MTSSGGTRKTPKPSCGISSLLFNITVGVSVTTTVLPLPVPCHSVAVSLRGSVLAPVVPRLGPLGLALPTLPVARVMAGWRLRLVARHGGFPRYDEQHGDEREQDDVEHAQRHNPHGREQIIRTGWPAPRMNRFARVVRAHRAGNGTSVGATT